MPIEGNQLLAAGGSWEPQRQNNWLVQFSGGNAIGLQRPEFYLALKSFPYPAESNAVKSISWWNEKRKFAGSLGDFADLSLQLVDYLDKTTAQIMIEWRRLVWQPGNASLGQARNYKLNGVLYLAPVNVATIGDASQFSRKIFLQGVWPSHFNMGLLSMDNDGDPVTIDCTLTYDRAYPGSPDGKDDPTQIGPQAIPATP